MSGPGGGANGRTSWAPYAEQREPKAVHKRPGLPEKSQSGGGTSDNIQLSEPTREAGALRQSLPARWTQTPRTRSVRSGSGHWDGPRHGQPCAARQVVRPGRAQSLRCPASATFGTNSPARMVLASESCFEGTSGEGRVYADGSVGGVIRLGGSASGWTQVRP